MSATLTTAPYGQDAADQAPPETPAPRWVRAYQRNERLLLGVVGVAIVLAIWELSVPALMRPVQLSSPSRIFEAGVRNVSSPRFYSDLAASGTEFALGFAIAAALGVPLGILAGWYRGLEAALGPWVNGINATSRIAFLPLLIIWLGLGLTSKVVLVFLSAFFPLILNTMAGVKTTDMRFIRAARCFGAGERRLLWTVILPNATPMVIGGLRQAGSRALVGVVAAELFGADVGLGAMLSKAGDQLRTADLMFGVLTFSVFGLLFTEVLRRFERHFEAWRPAVQPRHS